MVKAIYKYLPLTFLFLTFSCSKSVDISSYTRVGSVSSAVITDYEISQVSPQYANKKFYKHRFTSWQQPEEHYHLLDLKSPLVESKYNTKDNLFISNGLYNVAIKDNSTVYINDTKFKKVFSNKKYKISAGLEQSTLAMFNRSGEVAIINLKDSKVIKHLNLNHTVYEDAYLDRLSLYVKSYDGKLISINLTDGSINWKVTTEEKSNELFLAPTYGNIFGDKKGTVYTIAKNLDIVYINKETGKILNRLPISQFIEGILDESTIVSHNFKSIAWEIMGNKLLLMPAKDKTILINLSVDNALWLDDRFTLDSVIRSGDYIMGHDKRSVYSIALAQNDRPFPKPLVDWVLRLDEEKAKDVIDKKGLRQSNIYESNTEENKIYNKIIEKNKKHNIKDMAIVNDKIYIKVKNKIYSVNLNGENFEEVNDKKQIFEIIK